MATEIVVPTLGESVTEATVGKWFKKAGDAVKADEALAELETDKVTLEVNAPVTGVISEIAVKEGETVAVGAILGSIAEGQIAAAPAAPARSRRRRRPRRKRKRRPLQPLRNPKFASRPRLRPPRPARRTPMRWRRPSAASPRSKGSTRRPSPARARKAA